MIPYYESYVLIEAGRDGCPQPSEILASAADARGQASLAMRTGAGSLPRAGCSDAMPVASTYEGFQIAGSVCPSTLLAQVRYLVLDVCVVADPIIAE